MTTYFNQKIFTFLKELANNNNKDWFTINKQRYENDVKEPMLQFITDLAPKLSKIDKHYVADPKPSGGSLFRIYRDVRFSKDKSPYKTHLGAHFRHKSGDSASSLGFYLHIEPSACIAGGGIWHPDPQALKKIRNYLASHPAEWKKVRAAQLKISGNSLVKAPQGFDPEHPFIEDIKRKDFFVMFKLSNKDVSSDTFLERYLEICKQCLPLMRFLEKALNLK